MADQEAQQPQPQDDSGDVNQRLAFPLLVPVVVFLFAVLVIYGLSRVYLELNTVEVGDVTMATPLAIGVSLFILGSAWFLANNRNVTIVQSASIAMLAVFALTGGAIWAAVDNRGEGGTEVVATETPTGGTPGVVQVDLIDPQWSVTASPDSAAAGDVSFNITNAGVSVHNFHLVRTDLDPGSLPLDSAGLQVDLTNLQALYASADLSPGESESASVTLEAGNYVLFCNIAGHYQQGMHIGFTVQ